jgi:hypothetical protein
LSPKIHKLVLGFHDGFQMGLYCYIDSCLAVKEFVLFGDEVGIEHVAIVAFEINSLD